MNINVLFLLAELPVPIIIMAFSASIWRNPPKREENFGYRTKRALRSESAWNYAQELYGRICTITFAIMSALTLIAGLIPVIARLDEGRGAIISGMVFLADLILMFVIIFIVEGKLKKNFDKNGNRKGNIE